MVSIFDVNECRGRNIIGLRNEHGMETAVFSQENNVVYSHLEELEENLVFRYF